MRSNCSNRTAPPVRKLLLALAASAAWAAGATGLPVAAHAQESAGYDIPAGPLAGVLNRFAREVGVELIYDAGLTQGLASPGLKGSFSPAAGLSRLLAGTGLTFRQTGARAFTIERAPQVSGDAVQLGPVRVEGAAEPSGIARADSDPLVTEGTGSYTTRAVSVGGRTPRDPKQVQQSVSVVTEQRIRDQNLTDLPAALAQAPGVTMVTSANGVNDVRIYARGFNITSVQTDGGAPALTGNFSSFYLPDLAIYDHVEVLRGSDGLFAGVGDPGGTVNLVRKRPLDHGKVVFDALAGSWQRYRVQLDATGPVGWDGKLRARAVAAYEDRDYFYDVAKQSKLVLYGVLEADVTPDTLLTLGASHERSDAVPNITGLPRYSNGDDLHLPRSTCLCAPWEYIDTRTTELFGKLEQKFGPDWALRANLSWRRQRGYNKYAILFSSGVDPDTFEGPFLRGISGTLPADQTLADVSLDGKFEVAGLANELLLGASLQNVDADGTTAGYLDYRAFPNMFELDPVLHSADRGCRPMTRPSTTIMASASMACSRACAPSSRPVSTRSSGHATAITAPPPASSMSTT